MIAILDYGLGNVRAFQNVYERLSLPVVVASEPEQLNDAERIILPGVGAFDDAVTRLNRSRLRAALDECVLGRRIPVLGVCVGMQMLGETSEEGRLPGLRWVKGRVKRFSEATPGSHLWVPHMGWNAVSTRAQDALFWGLERGARFYFLHSFYFEADVQDHVIATTEYGREFACAVRCGNVYGVQFHPEKSHGWGMQLLENFAKVGAARAKGANRYSTDAGTLGGLVPRAAPEGSAKG